MEVKTKKSLKDLREEKGLTQVELANEWHMPIRTFQGWEAGNAERLPYVAKLGIANYFGEDLDNLEFV